MLRYIVVAVLAVFLVVATDIEVWAGEFDGTWKYELNSRSSSPTCRGFGTGEVEILDSKFSGVVAHDQDTFRLTGSVDESGKGKNLKASGKESNITAPNTDPHESAKPPNIIIVNKKIPSCIVNVNGSIKAIYEANRAPATPDNIAETTKIILLKERVLYPIT